MRALLQKHTSSTQGSLHQRYTYLSSLLQIVPTSGLRSVSLWDAPTLEALREWCGHVYKFASGVALIQLVRVRVVSWFTGREDTAFCRLQGHHIHTTDSCVHRLSQT